ncbi:MAG: glycoside hydrolase family 9 protein [Kineosporiaceae bacterium]
MARTPHQAAPQRGRWWTASAALAALIASGVGATTSGAGPASAVDGVPKLTTTPYANLAQALQTSLYFYDAEKSGPARSLGRQPLEWRGDSEPQDSAIPLVPGKVDDGGIVLSGTNLPAEFIAKNKAVLDPDGDGTVDLSRGFHDAGDHVKFGLPQGYAASTLAWGLYEFKDAYVTTGTYTHLMDELYWFTDYFLKSTFRDKDGSVVAFAYQLGNGSADHTYWGPPEMQTTPRGAVFAYPGKGASDQTSEAAASLAAMSLLTKDSDPAYAKKCLETATALYRFGVDNRGLGVSGGFYGSGYDEDELSWAATWLYLATGQLSYVEDVLALKDGRYTGWMGKIIKTPADDWQNSWVHSWDAVWAGVFTLLAPATKGKIDDTLNKSLWYYSRWNLEWWSGGAVPHLGGGGGGYINTSNAGFSVIATWGSARYNSAAQLCALVYRKHAADDPGGSLAQGEKLAQWALGQMNYILGDNPLHRSYEVGFTAKAGDTYAAHPHHRAAHGSSTNDMNEPKDQKHVLWGALVGGPDDADQHNDITRDYVYNEVAIDYNAGFVGALAGLWTYFGQGQPVGTWTPPLEGPERAFFTLAKVAQDDKRSSQISLQVNSRSSRPPAKVDDLSVRYYFDIAELVAHGLDIGAVTAEVQYDEGWALGDTVKATVGTPVHYSGTVYYVEFSLKGKAFWGKRDAMIALSAKQDSTWTDRWDPSNDPSHVGMSTTALGEARVTTYRDGVLVDGTEPDGTTPKPTTPKPTTPKPTTSKPATSKPTTSRPTTSQPTTSKPAGTTTTSSRPSSTTCTAKKCTRKTTTAKPCTAKKCTTTKKCTAKKCSTSTKKTTPKKSTRKSSKKATVQCAADVRLTSAWPGGFQALVTVTAGPSGAAGWTLDWAVPRTALTQVSGAALLPRGTGSLLRGPAGDDVLAPGASRTVSVVGTAPGTLLPQVACSV